jgi:4-alpha-glucanotransferase
LFYKTLKEIDKESILIGEVWEDASNKRSYDEFREYLLGEDLDSVMNYPLRKIILDFVLGNEDATYTTRALMSLRENYPIQHFYATMNHISNHDLPRIITVIKEHFQTEDEHLVFKVLKLITLFQMTVPGVPCIYYGDEVGVEGGKDPENRKTYPWGREDKALFTWYQQIIQLRNDLDVLKVGNFKPLYAMDHILSYRRCIEGSRDVFGNAKSNDDVMVIINRSSNEEETFEMSVDTNKIYIDIFNEIFYGVEDNKLTITLEPLGYRVLREVN